MKFSHLAFLFCTLLLAAPALCTPALPTTVSRRQVPTLPQLLGSAGNYNILVTLLNATGLLPTVLAADDITIFAPTDYAFKQTARDFGCPDVSSNAKVIKCLSGLVTPSQLQSILLYHVLPIQIGPVQILLRNTLKTLAGKDITSIGIRLIDLAAGVPDARLVLTAIDMKYGSGTVHTINRVMLPLLNVVPPCARITNLIVTATEKVVPLALLRLATSSCTKVRNEIKKCNVRGQRCFNQRAKMPVADGINLGRMVAAFTTCKAVTVSTETCG